VDRSEIADRLFAGVMAPLVLGGPLLPGHAIGARTALSFGDDWLPGDRDLADRVAAARVRRARKLVPIDTLPDPGAADWALGAAFHDLLQTANPIFDAPLRRRSAARILDLVHATLERVPASTSAREALVRHTWLARAPEVARTDTEVKWWVGSRTFLGVDPPDRLTAWPEIRRVEIIRRPTPLLELAPLAVDRDRLSEALSTLLARTPLTDLATCTRAAPAFAWRRSTLALLGTRAGRTLAFRALARVPQAAVDAVLGTATRELLAQADRTLAAPVLSLLAERTLMELARDDSPAGSDRGRDPEVTFAHALGAVSARSLLGEGAPEGGDGWTDRERARLSGALARIVRSPAGREARALLEPPAARAE
jgi:hypothetical protein